MEPNQTATAANTAMEIAPGVFYAEIGGGISRSNVFFVRSESSWVLVDAASAHCAPTIRAMAESLFGADLPPASILLTHYHPDHAGSALDLARAWDCPVYLHPDELPLAIADDFSTFEWYANPLDRWIVLPVLRAMPRRRVEAMFARSNLRGIARAFDPAAALPDLPGWQCIPTPGHTPGHIALFRPEDRVLIAGDALVTADVNSLRGFLSWLFGPGRQRLSGGPWYATWDAQGARRSAGILATLEPRVVAGGHGVPMAGPDVAPALRAFAGRYQAELPARRRAAIFAVKAVHSLIFLSVAASVLHVFYAGITNRVSRWTNVALALALGESLLFVANRFRCPLTKVAEDLGAESGKVTDIFLPRWFADRIPWFFGPPLVAGILALLWRRRSGR